MASLNVVLPRGWTKLPIGKSATPESLLAAMGISTKDPALWSEVLNAATAVSRGGDVSRACLIASYSQVIEDLPIGAGLMISVLDGADVDLTTQELLWRADSEWTTDGRVSLGCGAGLLRQRVAVINDYALGNAEVYSAQIVAVPFSEHPPLAIVFSSPNSDLREVLLRLFLAICSSIRITGD